VPARDDTRHDPSRGHPVPGSPALATEDIEGLRDLTSRHQEIDVGHRSQRPVASVVTEERGTFERDHAHSPMTQRRGYPCGVPHDDLVPHPRAAVDAANDHPHWIGRCEVIERS
jgi:hypothetical protein